MFNILLHQPQIPPNTGNIMRLCANTGFHLHLVRPLGFNLSERSLERAGLDYRNLADTTVHASWQEAREALTGSRFFGFTAKGETNYTDVAYAPNDVLVFGSEQPGLPKAVLTNIGEENCLRIPMVAQSRSLNLANAVALVSYEAWRQQGFPKSV